MWYLPAQINSNDSNDTYNSNSGNHMVVVVLVVVVVEVVVVVVGGVVGLVVVVTVWVLDQKHGPLKTSYSTYAFTLPLVVVAATTGDPATITMAAATAVRPQNPIVVRPLIVSMWWVIDVLLVHCQATCTAVGTAAPTAAVVMMMSLVFMVNAWENQQHLLLIERAVHAAVCSPLQALHHPRHR